MSTLQDVYGKNIPVRFFSAFNRLVFVDYSRGTRISVEVDREALRLLKQSEERIFKKKLGIASEPEKIFNESSVNIAEI